VSLQPTIAVDFDGTLCDHQFPEIGAVKPGARAGLALFRRMGYRVVINTCRTCSHHCDIFGGHPGEPALERPRVQEMIAFLDAQGMEYDEVDDGSRGKVLASVYIDDRGVFYEDNWERIAAWVVEHGPL
jgi:hypothetical protein